MARERETAGGLTRKSHHAVDGKVRPLAVVVIGGQHNDGAMLGQVLGDIRVSRPGPGRLRTPPGRSDRGQGVRGRGEPEDVAAPQDQGRDHAGATRLLPGPARAARVAAHRAWIPTSTGNATSSRDRLPWSSNGGVSPPATTNSPSLTAPQSPIRMPGLDPLARRHAPAAWLGAKLRLRANQDVVA